MHDSDGEAYRVVRHRAAAGDVERAVVDDGTGAAELLIVPAAARAAWEHQVRVMAECGSRHLPALRDLALDADGSLRVVRSIVSGERLDGLLATPGWCTPGRAVTVLHPMISTVRAAHDQGAVLGGPEAHRIRVSAEGCPVIADLTGAHWAAALPAALRARDPAHLIDLEALARLRDAVIHALDASGYADTAASLPPVTDALADPDVLLRWSAAEPLVGDARPTATPRDDMPRPADAERVNAPQGDAATISRLLRQVGLPSALTACVDDAVSEVTTRARRARARASGVSRRTLIMAAAGAAVLAAVLITAAVPSVSGDRASDTADLTGANTEVRDAPAEETPGGDGDAPADPTLAAEPDDWSAVVGELVARWRSCVRDQRRLCDGALHGASRAAEARAMEQDDALEPLAALFASKTVDTAVVERSGDAVVVTVDAPETTPASLLLIRSEAGWRIRDAWT